MPCPHHAVGHPNNCTQCALDRIKDQRDLYRDALEEVVEAYGDIIWLPGQKEERAFNKAKAALETK